ncbi:MAG: VWA domain-containing protein [Pseudomonadota bacterium]
MADEFDDLKRAFEAATPEPDATRKRETIARATEIYAESQGLRVLARQTGRKSWISRLLDGVKSMFGTLTTRGGLVATTGLVAVAAVFVNPVGRDMLAPNPLLPGAVVPVDERSAALNETARAPEPEDSILRDNVDASAGTDGREGSVLGVTGDVLSRQRLEEADASQATVAPVVEAESIAPTIQGRAMTDRMLAAPAPVAKSRRGAVEADALRRTEGTTEAFANAPENTLKVVRDDPVSTFSIDVDTASYAIVRSSVMAGQLPPRDAVRVEEMINYFPYDYPTPDGAHPFEPTISVVPTPWNAGTQLVHIGIQGVLPAVEDRPPLNLVFLIDTSGSMQDANKLPLLKQSFRLMLGALRPEDEVSIVTYAGSAGQVLAPTKAEARTDILDALERLEAGGSTAGQAGLRQAYQVAESMAADGEVTRVILATDGDFNVGLSDPAALKDFIAEKRDSGTYLSVLGFGRGNLDDATMQALAQNGNGQAAYIDTLSEARKVLLDQLTGALFPIANDVKLQVEFNPATIAEYRLIGYETRTLRREDFNNDRVDAGDIGAGHRVTALYEVTPVGSDAIRNTPLRYGDALAVAEDGAELGYFKMRYKLPGTRDSILMERAIPVETGAASTDVAFSVAVAGFGSLLRGDAYLGDWGWEEVIALAAGARGSDALGYRSEAITLMRLAEALDQ